MWAFIFITVLTVLPSLILNIVSFLWWIDDVSVHSVERKMKHAYSKQLIFRVVMSVLQVINLFDIFISDSFTMKSHYKHFKSLSFDKVS